MKSNESLKALERATKFLTLFGLGALAVGGLTAVSGGIAFGLFLLYLGSALVGLAIFSAFLKLTAASIVEGMGGNIRTDVDNYLNSLAHQNILNELTEKQVADWKAAGEPSLVAWRDAGKPDFKNYNG